MRRVERWIFSDGTPERLAAIRIGLCSVLALRLTRTVYLSIAGQPHSLYRPLSFMHLLHSMPPWGVVLPIQVVGGIAAGAGRPGTQALVGPSSLQIWPIGHASPHWPQFAPSLRNAR